MTLFMMFAELCSPLVLVLNDIRNVNFMQISARKIYQDDKISGRLRSRPPKKKKSLTYKI